MFVSVCVPPLLPMNQRDADDFSLKKIKIRLTIRRKTKKNLFNNWAYTQDKDIAGVGCPPPPPPTAPPARKKIKYSKIYARKNIENDETL